MTPIELRLQKVRELSKKYVEGYAIEQGLCWGFTSQRMSIACEMIFDKDPEFFIDKIAQEWDGQGFMSGIVYTANQIARTIEPETMTYKMF